jgi:hypothetical protein
MVALLCFFLTLLASLFESKSRLDAENAALRPQLILLRRKVRGRVHLGRCIGNFYQLLSEVLAGKQAEQRFRRIL